MQTNEQPLLSLLRSERRRHALMLCLIIALAYFYCRNAVIVGDEVVHEAQIRRFLLGDFSIDPRLTTIPGYHLLVAALSWPFGAYSLATVRGISTLFGTALVLVYALLLRDRLGAVSPQRLVQFAFFPIFLPYFYLAYTDVLSLLLVLGGLWLALRKQAIPAALVLGLSICVRQQNVIWLLAVPVLAYCRDSGFRWCRDTLKAHATGAGLYALALAGFIVFVLWNGGVAVGDRGAHQLSGLFVGNVFFMLLLYAIFLLPSVVANLPATLAYARHHGFVPLLLAGLLVVYLFGFQNSHPYNAIQPEYFLRNGLLTLLSSSLPVKLLFFVPIALAALDWLAMAQRRPELYVIGGFSLLALLPSWLIEQRYMMIPFALLLLYRDDDRPGVQALTGALYAIVAVVFVYGTATLRFFL
ncbi:hypothetical protein [Jeongeupia chitinilytica]|uniref:Glycosyltransferase RgtA/B/C/D-like domain-containing protein n=1 Tax=Jeongeupia chitinilytica TaxID=1041641 RepID=A0ABQ3GZC5_9NEIS|nr:hypothetical protein [Jeongeupia chitinilytica]GHD62602.1 hypothetical protein GCM10007350_18880 [Jeongeupia chitinilytica]